MKMLLLFFISLISTVSIAENESDDIKSYSLDILFTTSEDFFDAYENSDDIDPIGSFFGNKENSISLSINMPYNYFGTSDYGYYYNYNLKTFNFNKQDTTIKGSDVTEKDIGTSVSGYNLYAYASIFANFGDKFIITDNNSALKLGIGAGLGYLKADGNIILTEEVGSPLINVNISEFGLAFGLYVDYRYGPWVFKIEVFGTEAKQGPLLFEYVTIPIQLGYSYKF